MSAASFTVNWWIEGNEALSAAGGAPARRAFPAIQQFRFAALALALVAGACVSGSYTADSLHEPIVTERLEALRPGHDTLATCLRELGAPNRVLEYRVEPDGSSGMALLWFWRDESGWGLELSTPADEVPASVAYSADVADLPGCVLWFDVGLVLERWRAGPVGELLPGRVRPSVPDA